PQPSPASRGGSLLWPRQKRTPSLACGGGLGCGLPGARLFIQPRLLETPAVKDAVDLGRDPVHPRVMAGGEVVAPDDRAGGVLGQLLVDLPDQLLALLLVRFDRLLLVHLFEFGVAIVGVVALRTARVMLEEIGVRVVDPAAGQIAGDQEVLAGELGK